MNLVRQCYEKLVRLFKVSLLLFTLTLTTSFSYDHKAPNPIVISSKKPSYQFIFINGLGITKDGNYAQLNDFLYYEAIKNEFPTFIRNNKKKYKVSIYEHNAKLDDIKFSCDDLVVVGSFSWGFDLHRRFSEKFFLECGRALGYSFTVDSIAKPFFFSAPSNSIIANECVNYFQSSEFPRGKRMSNCDNHEYKDDSHVGLYMRISRKYKESEFSEIYFNRLME